jgi:hypothetical protein
MTSISRGVVVALVAGALSGCGVEEAAAAAGECVGASVGRSIGSGLGAGLQEQLGPFGDWAAEGAPGSGVTLSISARHRGGRLFLAFEGPVADGALPRFPTPGDCVHQDTLGWRSDADGVLYPVSGAVSFDGGWQPGNPGVDVSLSGLVRALPDGSTAPLADVRLVLPVR